MSDDNGKKSFWSTEMTWKESLQGLAFIIVILIFAGWAMMTFCSTPEPAESPPERTVVAVEPTATATPVPRPTATARPIATRSVAQNVERGCDAASELLTLMENLDEAGIERNVNRLALALINTGDPALDSKGEIIIMDMASAEQYDDVYDAFWVITSGLETYIDLCELQGY